MREARGQRLIIENGEVKDVSPNVSLATRTPTVTRTGRVIRKPEDPDFEHQIVESQDGNVYEITEETMVTDQDHVDEDVDESSLEQDDTMDMSGYFKQSQHHKVSQNTDDLDEFVANYSFRRPGNSWTRFD